MKDNDKHIKLYNRLAVLRAEQGLSRQDLAERLGVHYQTVGYLERGEYKPSLLVALNAAQLFGVSVEDIFSLTPFETISRTLPK